MSAAGPALVPSIPPSFGDNGAQLAQYLQYLHAHYAYLQEALQPANSEPAMGAPPPPPGPCLQLAADNAARDAERAYQTFRQVGLRCFPANQHRNLPCVIKLSS